MPKFRVLKRVDAWVNYETVIEADSKEAAHATAEADVNGYFDGDNSLKWEEIGVSEYDDVTVDLDEVEEITDDEMAE